MPTAGDYEIEFFWLDGNIPDGEHQESVWWEKGAVCKVGLGDFEVVIYVDGVDLFIHKVTGEQYTNASELNILGADTDKRLREATGSDGYLIQNNNSWFDIYTSDGEHLDMVNHEADEAFDQACEYLIEQFVNVCMIENNQMPQVEGRQVVVLDLE
jgi:hypothetical protein